MNLPNGIAMDPSTGNLYYSASNMDVHMDIISYIAVVNPHSGQHKVLISQLNQVTDIVLHPQKG